jgi:hypothetical protein
MAHIDFLLDSPGNGILINFIMTVWARPASDDGGVICAAA